MAQRVLVSSTFLTASVLNISYDLPASTFFEPFSNCLIVPLQLARDPFSPRETGKPPINVLSLAPGFPNFHQKPEYTQSRRVQILIPRRLQKILVNPIMSIILLIETMSLQQNRPLPRALAVSPSFLGPLAPGILAVLWLLHVHALAIFPTSHIMQDSRSPLTTHFFRLDQSVRWLASPKFLLLLLPLHGQNGCKLFKR